MNQGLIQAAFDAKLKTFMGGGDVQTQTGAVYTPSQGKPYLYGKMSAFAPVAAAVGANAPRAITGSYTVNVMRPSVEGTRKAGQVAAAVAQLFRRGQSLAVGTSEFVQLTNAAEQQILTQADWITIPVVCSFIGTDNPATGE